MSSPNQPAASTRREWIPWAVGLCATVIALVIYSPALSGPFVFDDIYLPMLQRAMPLRAWLAGGRPMVMLSYWLNFYT
ncbi:MAG: hypothetical protein NTY38_25680 [Acidobacteria bacterium]|nr:hypothetical protein [Acidobacteriota bacterium]